MEWLQQLKRERERETEGENRERERDLLFVMPVDSITTTDLTEFTCSDKRKCQRHRERCVLDAHTCVHTLIKGLINGCIVVGVRHGSGLKQQQQQQQQ